MTTATTCLIVDDDVDDQEIFSLAMNDIGRNYHCIFINNAIEALEQLKDGSILPHYIFLDLNMPRMNGLQCLEHFREMPSLAHIPVVIYSTSAEQSYIDKTRALGAVAFITKPPTLTMLSRSLDDFFSEHQSSSMIA